MSINQLTHFADRLQKCDLHWLQSLSTPPEETFTFSIWKSHLIFYDRLLVNIVDWWWQSTFQTHTWRDQHAQSCNPWIEIVHSNIASPVPRFPLLRNANIARPGETMFCSLLNQLNSLWNSPLLARYMYMCSKLPTTFALFAVLCLWICPRWLVKFTTTFIGLAELLYGASSLNQPHICPIANNGW